MRIVLAAARREENIELGLMAIGSYTHMICRRSEASAIFFPLTYLPFLPSFAEAAIQKISLQAQVSVGVGYEENGVYRYALFHDGRIERLSPKEVSTIEIRGAFFRFSAEEIPESGKTPVLYLHNRQEEVRPEECQGAYELYDLGPCLEGRYEAIVFQNGAVKCRLLPERPSFLMKSVEGYGDL